MVSYTAAPSFSEGASEIFFSPGTSPLHSRTPSEIFSYQNVDDRAVEDRELCTCGGELEPDAVFCRKCGAKRAEARLPSSRRGLSPVSPVFPRGFRGTPAAVPAVPTLRLEEVAATRREGDTPPEQQRETAAKGWLAGKAGPRLEMAMETASSLRSRAIVMVKQPHLHAASVSAAAGAIALGAVGGVVGAASGMGMGLAAGTAVAPFTLGLSMPVGTAIGGAVGLCAGTAVGGGTGAVGAGAVGYAAYLYRVEISDGVIRVKVSVSDGVDSVTVRLTCVAGESKAKALVFVESTKVKVKARHHATKLRILDAAGIARTRVHGGASYTQTRARDAVEYAKTKAKDFGEGLKRNKVCAGGAVVFGTAGGAVGTVAGGAAGAAAGVPAAIFTFGWSIPMCAAVGSGMGLCTGLVAGGSAGAATGAAFAHRAELKDRARGAWKSVQESAGILKAKAGELHSGVAGEGELRTRMNSDTGSTN